MTRSLRFSPFSAVVLALLIVNACGDDEMSPASSQALEIVGSYVDNFGAPHVITADTWSVGAAPDTSTFHIRSFSNADQYVVAENDAGNAFNPGLFSRFDWTVSEGTLWFCQSAFDAASEEAARAASGADRGDLEGTGCGGFGWQTLTETAGS